MTSVKIPHRGLVSVLKLGGSSGLARWLTRVWLLVLCCVVLCCVQLVGLAFVVSPAVGGLLYTYTSFAMLFLLLATLFAALMATLAGTMMMMMMMMMLTPSPCRNVNRSHRRGGGWV
jgi:hypothetical protein